MAEATIVGTRIRRRRLLSGMRQTELAQAAGISPSYLNLIEHNRRRIGGKLLLRLALALEVEPSVLSQGAEAALINGLREVASAGADAMDSAPETDRLEEFAGRFPGWAQLLLDTFRRGEDRDRVVKVLTDRLAHDPNLAGSIHELLSVVTAIHSTAAILVETPALEPEWQARFHRNINEDSLRLAEGAKSLVRYLDAAPGSETDIKSPQDELDLFLAENDYFFEALEQGPGDAVEAVLEADTLLSLPSSRKLAHAYLTRYHEDAQAVPQDRLRAAVARCGLEPMELARDLGTDLALVFRRLAAMPEAEVGPVGLAVCDATGTLLMRKPIDGFAVSRLSGACPLWPMYQVLSRPDVPLRTWLLQAGRDAQPVQALAVAERVGPQHYNTPPLLRSFMLLLPASGAAPPPPVDPVPVGTSCRVCPRAGCPARREPSVIRDDGL